MSADATLGLLEARTDIEDRSRSLRTDSSPPRVDAKFLRVGGKRFWIRGVTYGSFAKNEEGEPFPPFAKLCEDFARMGDVGINTVRIYWPPSDRIADAAAKAGLHLVPDICWGPRRCELDDPERVRFIFDWTRSHARRLSGHPAILMHSIGNEIPPLMVRWYGRRRIERFIERLYETVKEQSPDALVTYVNHPPTEHLRLPFLDVVSYNVFLEREPEFRAYLAHLQARAGERPLFLAELGLDSRDNGAVSQARTLDWQLRAVIEKGLCGAAVYSWTDEWSIFDGHIEGWEFGLTDSGRRARPALDTVAQIYRSDMYRLREGPWPRVSVIVCSYNGAETLTQTLDALLKLNYPDYELLLINDGSTDNTREVAARYPVRNIEVENGGLSRARNLGIENATGSVVAFIDSDAYPDPDWLYFLVTTLEEQDAAAVGGPNLTPQEGGLTSQCVDHAPGNPTHVLIDNESAEHVPGCNMAFRKQRIEQIGCFDPTHRAAGDDVDVCWKLLLWGERIAFSPSAVVWHHRRPTNLAYLRQQKGYGFAEAHLQQRHPGRFNFFGDLVWAGRIYDGPQSSLLRFGLPRLFRTRIYQGRFGSAQFQSIYQPYQAWWFQTPTMVEWQLSTWCVLLSGLLALFMSSAAVSATILGASALMFVATIVAAMIPACQAAKVKGWKGLRRIRGCVNVACLHIVQPLVRATGRISGWWKIRGRHTGVATDQRIWGNLAQREKWLEHVGDHLRSCGWQCRPCDDWSDADLEIPGPGPYRLRLRSVYEETLEHGWHFVRFRIIARPKALWLLFGALLLSTLPAFVMFPYLAPLALPVGVLLTRLLRAKRQMSRGVAQLAMECGEPLGMPRVDWS